MIREPVIATKRKKLSRTARLFIWEKHKGVCILCKKPINPQKEGWIGEHVIPLAIGGPDAPANMGPAHVLCAAQKTKKDHADIARAKKLKAREVGATPPSDNPIRSRGFARPEKKPPRVGHLDHLPRRPPTGFPK